MARGGIECAFRRQSPVCHRGRKTDCKSGRSTGRQGCSSFEYAAAEMVKIIMATETLHFENAPVAQQLFNHEPRNLQALETELGVKATSRDGWIKLEGAADAVERARQLFVSLQSLVKAGAPVRNREFAHALNVVKHEGVSTLKDLMSDRVLKSC